MSQSRSETTTSAATASEAGGGWLRRAAWALALAALIVFASSRPYLGSPGLIRAEDKIGHFAIYGLLGTLVCRIGNGWRAAVWSLLIVSAFGATDEWLQSFVPGRRSDVRDWISDTLGAALAVALHTGWPWYRRLLETPVRWPRRRDGKR